MIALLTGIVALRNDPHIILDVNGVGYKVRLAENTLSQIGNIGDKIKVFTYTYVREDALALYGFISQEDLVLFELLLSVSGIGPKTALSIFSFGSSDQIQQAIVASNVDFFVSVPRLGKKNAQKIIIELKSKIGSTRDLDLSDKDRLANQDVIEALKSFGFLAAEAVSAVRQIKEDNLSTQEKIRKALKYLGKK